MKYLTKLKETLMNYVWEESHVQKIVRIEFSLGSGFSNMLHVKKRKAGNVGNQQKSLFQASMVSFVDIFEQNFENCLLTTQNASKNAWNQINGLYTSKNQFMRIFRGFQVFEYALWQKPKTQKWWKSTESFLNKNTTTVKIYYH